MKKFFFLILLLIMTQHLPCFLSGQEKVPTEKNNKVVQQGDDPFTEKTPGSNKQSEAVQENSNSQEKEQENGNAPFYGPLSPMEKHVIEDKGTELRGTGRYQNTFDLGVYACRKCGAPLYRSDDKFASSCGWPAFDNELPGAVKRTPDADGIRTEITCTKCGGHLGHVFIGEFATPRDTRHCVNSVSLVLESQRYGRIKRAVFAGGCFWGVEEMMRHQKGVLAAVSGYTGGRTTYPTYKKVCSNTTGHAEAVEVYYDSKLTDFETLCRYFLEIHDPTQLNRQGPDFGSQYRSAIFYLDPDQKKTAEDLLKILRNKGLKIATKVQPFKHFWPAEDYHQNYYQRKGKQPYCHSYKQRF